MYYKMLGEAEAELVAHKVALEIFEKQNRDISMTPAYNLNPFFIRIDNGEDRNKIREEIAKYMLSKPSLGSYQNYHHRLSELYEHFRKNQHK